VLLTSHEYVVNVVNWSQCVLFIELNEWEDEWLVIIESLITKKKENKEGEEKIWSNLWLIHQYLQIGRKLRLPRFKKKSHASKSQQF
jgi:hypothetical protein